MLKYIIHLNLDTFSLNEFCHSFTFIYIMFWAITSGFIVVPIGVEMHYISFLLNYFLSWCHNAMFNFLNKGKGFSSPFKISLGLFNPFNNLVLHLYQIDTSCCGIIQCLPHFCHIKQSKMTEYTLIVFVNQITLFSIISG